MSTMAPLPAIREKLDKSYHAEMPRIPGVEPRSTVPIRHAPNRFRPERSCADNVRRETTQPGEGNYAGPTTKPDLAAAFKRVAKNRRAYPAGGDARLMAIKMIMRLQQPESDVTPGSQEMLLLTSRNLWRQTQRRGRSTSVTPIPEWRWSAS